MSKRSGHHSGALSIQDTALPLASTVRQIDGLQVLRALAVVLVVLCHSGQILGNVGSKSLPTLGVFGIDIFFVISGFILSLATLKDTRSPGTRSSWLFLKRRFVRIYPIYWFIALLTLARLAHANHLFQKDYLPAFFLLPAPWHPFIFTYSWTMMFEVFFYLLLGLTLLKTIQRAVPVIIGILTFTVLLGAILGIEHPIWVVAANPILLEFVFGAIIALIYNRLGRLRTAGILITLAGVTASICVAYFNQPSVADGFQMLIANQGAFARVATWGVSAALIVGGVVFWSPTLDSFAGKWAVLMGNASYSAYLVSSLILEYSSRLYFHFSIPSQTLASRFAYQTAMVIADLVVGFTCYILVEKPMLQWLQAKLIKKPVRSSAHPHAAPSASSSDKTAADSSHTTVAS